ncbi:MAG: transglycosylase domain-containing protein [Ignavibacteriae bacterium]|nr:transglycosylase domain-containing protein [Ignavibacteriota bacterium]
MGKNFSINKFIGYILGKIIIFLFPTYANNFTKILYNKYSKYIFSYKKINSNFINALIIAEDWRFYDHFGVDFIAILGAIKHNLTQNYLRGASTIEQQLVRIIINDFSISYKRKIKEIFLALIVDLTLPKIDIPGFYLSIAYYGYGLIGINKICNKYSINILDPSIDQACFIIAHIKYPSGRYYNEKINLRINNRTYKIKKLLKDNKYKKYFC